MTTTYLTASELAEYTWVSPSTIRKWGSSGRLPSHKTGRYRRYVLTEVLQCLARHVWFGCTCFRCERTLSEMEIHRLRFFADQRAWVCQECEEIDGVCDTYNVWDDRQYIKLEEIKLSPRSEHGRAEVDRREEV